MSLKCDIGLACDLCGECVESCPTDALSISHVLNKLEYDNSECQFCEVCMDVCHECAIRIYEVE